jgi:hypothetical protein
MVSQESGVLQRLLGFLDYGNEFVHFFVMGGFLKAQDMSKQARDKGAYSRAAHTVASVVLCCAVLLGSESLTEPTSGAKQR